MLPYGDYPDLKRVRRILVIKLRHHGDVLLASPLFQVLKTHVPHAEIDAYLYQETAPMLEGHPAISRFHLYRTDWKRLPLLARARQEWNLLRQIRRHAYDLVLNLTEGDRGAITAWLSGARYRAGWDPEGAGVRHKARLYTHLVRRSRLPRHMVEQNLDAARRIGVFPQPHERELVFHVPAPVAAGVEQRLRAANLTPGRFIVLHPTSRWLFKCWPLTQVVALVRALAQEGRQIVLSSAPDANELEIVRQVMDACAGLPITDFGGKLTLKELGALISMASGLVTVDSLPAHIASALKKPCVVLFGPSSEIAWGPWRNPAARVVAQDFSCRPCNLDGCGGGKVSDCLDTLPVESVLAAIHAVIGN